DDSGQPHHVWFTDGVTAYNQVKVADAWRPRGYALWRLGTADPTVWSVFGKAYCSADTTRLINLPPSQDVDYDGNGEILHVTATPTPGKRSLTVDPHSGLITHESYDTI